MGGVARAIVTPLSIIDKGLAKTVLQITAIVAGFIPGGQPLAAAAALTLAVLYKPKSPKPPQTEGPLKTSLPPRVSAYGVSRLHGAYILFETAENGTAVDGFAVHDGPVTQVLQRYLGDDKVTVVGGVVQEGADKRYKGGVVQWLESAGQTPGPAQPAIVALLPGVWTNAHRGDGVVTVFTTWKSIKQDKFSDTYPSGGPVPASIAAKWQSVFDWRDPTQSVADPATWKWSENAVLHLAHYRLVREKALRTPGQALPDGAALTAAWARYFAPTLGHWTTAANICDEAVPLVSGGTEPRYRSCVSHKHTDPHKEVIESLIGCFDGWTAPRPDGALVVYAGKLYEPTVDIGPAEIVSYSWQHGVDDENAVNEFTLTYVSAEHDYNTVECSAWQDPVDLLARGRLRAQGLENAVPSPGQARRLAKRLHARTMAPYRGTVTTNARGRKVRGERFINLRLEEAGAVFFDGIAEITQLTRNVATGGVTFSWIAVPAGIDSWDPATEEAPKAPAGPRVPPSIIETPVVTSVTTRDDGSGLNALIEITATAPVRDDLTWLIRWRNVDASTWNETSVTDVPAGNPVVLTAGPVPSGTELEVGVAYMTGDGRRSDWSNSEQANPPPPEGVIYDGGDVNGEL